MNEFQKTIITGKIENKILFFILERIAELGLYLASKNVLIKDRARLNMVMIH